MNQGTGPIQEAAGQEAVHHSPADRTEDIEAHRIPGRRTVEGEEPRIDLGEELHIDLGEDRRIVPGELRTEVEGVLHNHHHMKVGVEEHHIHLAESVPSWKPRSWGSDRIQTKTGLVVQESSRGSLQQDYHLYPPSSQDRGS